MLKKITMTWILARAVAYLPLCHLSLQITHWCRQATSSVACLFHLTEEGLSLKRLINQLPFDTLMRTEPTKPLLSFYPFVTSFLLFFVNLHSRKVFVFHWIFFVAVVKAMKRKGQSLFTVLFWALSREWSLSWQRILAENGNHFCYKTITVFSWQSTFCARS